MMNSVGFKHWEPSRGGREIKSWRFFSPMVGNGCRWIKKKSFIKKSPPPLTPRHLAPGLILYTLQYGLLHSLLVCRMRGGKGKERRGGERERRRGEREWQEKVGVERERGVKRIN